MNTGESLFLFGTPGNALKAKFIHFEKHPKNKNKDVAFLKHPTTGKLYFNMRDFIVPFKNKKYTRMVSRLFPKSPRDFSFVWMSVDAWTEIQTAIDENKGKEDIVVNGLKERYLF